MCSLKITKRRLQRTPLITSPVIPTSLLFSAICPSCLLRAVASDRLEVGMILLLCRGFLSGGLHLCCPVVTSPGLQERFQKVVQTSGPLFLGESFLGFCLFPLNWYHTVFLPWSFVTALCTYVHVLPDGRMWQTVSASAMYNIGLCGFVMTAHSATLSAAS